MSEILKINDIDIALITELYPKKSNIDLSSFECFNIEGYEFIYDRHGRGVGMFIKNNIIHERHANLEKNFNPSIICTVTLNKIKYNIGVVYKSPNLDKNSELNLLKLINDTTKTLNDITFVGDFNFPDIDWTNNFCHKDEDHISSLFLYTTEKNNLHQIIQEPTHVKPNTKPSLIDLILSKKPDIIENLTFHPPLGKSHHNAFIFNINHNVHKTPNKTMPITKYNISKGDFSSMRQYFTEINWNEKITEQMDVDSTWNIINDEITYARETFIPTFKLKNNKTFKRKLNSDDNTLHTKLKNKRLSFKHYKKYPNETNHRLYCKARNAVTKHVRKILIKKELYIAKNVKKKPKIFLPVYLL